MIQRIRNTYRWLRGWVPCTDLGALLLGLGLLTVFAYGLPREDYVVQLGGASVVGLVVLGMCSVVMGAVTVFRRASQPDESDAVIGFEATQGFALGRRWPGFGGFPLVEVSVAVEEPSGLWIEQEGHRERFEARHRSGASEVVRVYTVSDGFGLARVRFTVREPRFVRVAPWLGAVDQAPALTALAPGEVRSHPRGQPAGDRVELRPYVRGDPLRMVLWKVYARTGELMVRTPETARDQDTDVYAFFIAGTGDEASAAVAWVVMTRNLLGPRWRFGADGMTGATSDQSAVETAICRSRAFRHVSAMGLNSFLAEADPASGARVVLFVPCHPGEWINQAIEATARFSDRLTVVLGFDAESRPQQQSWFWTPPVVTKDMEYASRDQLDDVTRPFTRRGAEILVIDRSSGLTQNMFGAQRAGAA